MKKLFLTLFILILSASGFSQKISPLFFGQNAWMPDSVGTQRLYGQLDKKWGEIKNSGARLIRYGGIAPDDKGPNDYQYLKMVDSIRSRGMEPIIQVPFYNKKHQATNAARIVKFLNVTMKRNIKYWIIGNEPDHAYSYTTASQVSVYLKAYATAMKKEDPSILIIGPECAWYNAGILTGLTTPGGPDDVTGKDSLGHYYLDIISFHVYPFGGKQTRNDVLTKLTAAGSYESNITTLNNRIATCNTYYNRSGESALKIAITEANIGYLNPSTDDVNGLGGSSFVGGQFWVEMMGIAMKKGVAFMNFWSVIEGNSTESNIGFIDGFSGTKKSSYYHFKMMSENFRGSYISSTDNLANIKSFASKDTDQIAVIILNQDQTENLAYTVKLNTISSTSLNALKVNIDAGIDKEFSGTIDNQSTLLLLFDKNGTIRKKIEYKLKGHADVNLAPSVSLNITVANDLIENDPFQIHIFPNPSDGEFVVDINSLTTAEKSLNFEVVNLSGKSVYKKSLALENNHIKKPIHLDESLADGIYILNIRIGEKVYSTRIILTR